MAITYSKTGVDVKKIRKMQEGINSSLFQTSNEYTPNFIAGHYAGVFEAGNKKMSIHCDGVGSKLLVAQEMNKHDTVGIDAVAMNANDLVCMGSKPIVGVDYLALSRIDDELVGQVMKGLVTGCKEAGIALVGGETAILPDMIKGEKKYLHADYDLAMSVVGIFEHEVITGSGIREGDVLIGLESSGLHSNGFTLARKILNKKKFGMKMLTPTKIYAKPVLEMVENCSVSGIAHITGGAFSKLSRIGAHAKCGFLLDKMPKPAGIFEEIEGKLKDLREQYRTFNMGVGMVIVVSNEEKERIIQISEKYGIGAQVIGRAIAGNDVILQKNRKKISLL